MTESQPPPVICWPWHLWFLTEAPAHPRGGECAACRQDIAVPRDAVGQSLCLYCGMAAGHVEMIDKPFDEGSRL